MASRHIFVRDLKLKASIGVLDHERAKPQALVVTVTLEVDDAPVARDAIDEVVDYRLAVDHAHAILAEGHIDLVETFADRLATACLDHPGVRSVRLRVEKPDAIPGAAAAGVELFRESAPKTDT
jgi:dihydroneopterin aldolase